MKIRTMHYYTVAAFQSFWRNRFMSVASIATVAISLFILGIFMTLVANLDYFAENLESQVEITVYLKDGATQADIDAAQKALADAIAALEKADANGNAISKTGANVAVIGMAGMMLVAAAGAVFIARKRAE